MLFLADTNILLAYIRQGMLASRIEANYQLLLNAGDWLISVVSERELHTLSRQFNWGISRA